MDPLNITSANLESMVGNPTPFEKWAEWGRPETLDGTNNQYWVIYLPTANVSMVADKSTQTVLFADFGKTSAMDHVKKLK
ncbi:hypothetical protein C7967_1151 [Thalassospira sp. 11-3]|nr:hypothetical protein C7967_1151 [Thalassospira sp. 11-3]